MWQQIIKTFFIGQVLFEHAAQAAQDSFEAVKQNATEQAAQCKTEVQDRNIHFIEKLEEHCKEAIANLRQTHPPVEKACESLVKLLNETREMVVSSALD